MQVYVKISIALLFIGLLFGCPVVQTSNPPQSRPAIVGSWKAQSDILNNGTVNAASNTHGSIYTFNADGSFSMQISSYGLGNFIIGYTGNYTYDAATITLTINISQKYSTGNLVAIGPGDIQKTVYEPVGFSDTAMIIGVKGGNTSNLQGTWTGSTQTYLYHQSSPDASQSDTSSVVIDAYSINITYKTTHLYTAVYSGLNMAQSKITIATSTLTDVTNGGTQVGDNYFAIVDNMVSSPSTVQKIYLTCLINNNYWHVNLVAFTKIICTTAC